jgi:hypothetical protein
MLTRGRLTEAEATPAEPEVISDAVRLTAVPGTDVSTLRNHWVETLGVTVGVDWRGVPAVSAADAARVRRAWEEDYRRHAEAQAAYDQHLRLRAEEARRKRLESQRESAEREALRATAQATALTEQQRQRAAEEAERNWRRERQRLGDPPSFEEFQARQPKHEEDGRRIADDLAREEEARRRRLAAQRGA